MKRYMLFAGSDYYPKGGSRDFLGDFESVEELNSFLNKILPDFRKITGSTYEFLDGGWAECFDTKNRKSLLISRDEIIGFNWQDPEDPNFGLD